MFIDVQVPIRTQTDQKSIYLKKTGYKFVNSIIQEVSKSNETPFSLTKSLGILETECVYEVVFKSSKGKFLSFKEMIEDRNSKSKPK